MERCSATTAHILSKEQKKVVMLLNRMTAAGYEVIGAHPLVEEGVTIGSVTTLINFPLDMNEPPTKLNMSVRLDTTDSHGPSLDVDVLNDTDKRIRGEQNRLGIPHHNYI